MTHSVYQVIQVLYVWKYGSGYLCRRLASGEGIVSLGVRLSRCRAVCVCLSVPEPRLHALALVISAAKVMCCIQCSLFKFLFGIMSAISGKLSALVFM